MQESKAALPRQKGCNYEMRAYRIFHANLNNEFQMVE